MNGLFLLLMPVAVELARLDSPGDCSCQLPTRSLGLIDRAALFSSLIDARLRGMSGLLKVGSVLGVGRAGACFCFCGETYPQKLSESRFNNVMLSLCGVR